MAEQPHVGTKIKRWRDKKAWTQEHLASAASVSLRTVQRAEEGVMSAETLTAIAGALDVAVEELTYDESAYPPISPFLYYEHGSSFDWLVNVFGFGVRMKIPGPNGTVVHGELEHAGGIVMFGSTSEGDGCLTPRRAGGRTQSLYVMVPDADAHCARAEKEGARIVSRPVNAHGHRRYVAEDPEGHHWMFASVLH